MTYTEAFEKIKKMFKETDVGNISEDFAVQIDFTDEDCQGMFYIEIKDKQLYVEPYDYYDRRALLKADFKTIKDIFGGKTDVFKAVTEQKALVEGDETCIDLISKCIVKKPAKPRKTIKKAEKPEKKEEKKPAVKKAAEKKTAEKKSKK